MSIRLNNRPNLGPWALHPTALASAVSAAVPPSTRERGRAPERDVNVAVVHIDGPMSREGEFYGGTSTDYVRAALAELERDDQIDAILIKVNSPGGYVAGTKDLADAIARVKQSKPVYAHIQDIGASAAYWVASQADRVFASADASIGSIGAYMVLYDASEYLEKEGVTAHLIRAENTGEFKGAGAYGVPLTEAQLADFTSQVTASNQFFLDAVQEGRGMNKTQLAQISDGRVFSAADAVELGLIDEVASIDQAISKLVEATTQEDDMSEATVSAAQRIAQYREACPGADADMLVEWIEKDLSVLAAMTEYIAILEAIVTQQHEMIEAIEDGDDLEDDADDGDEDESEDDDTDVLEPVGVDPLNNPSAGTSGTSAEQWRTEIATLKASGKTNREAVSILKESNPALWESYVAEINS